VLAGLVDKVRTALRAAPALSPAAFKELTGQSRRTAIPLLEWLDAHGYTRRVGDERTAGPKLG
jgi:selenocysteine-specific elongation factor